MVNVRSETAPPVTPAPVRRIGQFRRRAAQSKLLPPAAGLGAALALLGLYLSTVTLAQDWEHAVQQLRADQWFIGPIIIGFGLQVALFTHLRQLNRRAHAGGVMASTGTSATAMVACCAHHLGEVLPIIGLSGAAVFLNAYRSELLWLGLIMTVGGTLYLARETYRQRKLLCDTGFA